MTLVKQYLEYQQDFERKYGEKTIVLMQVGAFFEMYGIENAKQRIGNVRRVAEKLNIILTRKKKAKLENNLKNPLMCGFQTPYLKRHLNVLLQDDFTVVIIEQDEVNKQKRSITGIYSPGTYIDDMTESDPNNVVSIFIDVEKCYKSGKKLLVLGCSCIDLSTGKNIVNQSHELINDQSTLIEDMNRFIVANNPKEVVLNISSKSSEDIVNDIKMNINLVNRKIMSREGMNREYGKISYQNAFLGKIFDGGALTPIEYLDLEMKPTAVKSYMHLLQFCYEHNPNFLKKIDKPIIWNHNEHLVLYNDTIYQLDVVSNNNHLSSGCKFKSLFHVLNKTRTAMGRRLLKYRLINPITSCVKLNKMYNKIEMFIENRVLLDRVIDKLRKIIDIERYNRRITLQSLHPSEFYSLDISYKCVCDLLDDTDLVDMGELTDQDFNKFNEFIEHYSKLFDVDEMGKYNLDNIDGNFVRECISEKIDEGAKRITTIDDIIEKERLRLIKLLNIETKGNKDPITLHISAEKKEYNYHMTKARYATLKKKKGFEMNEDTPYEHKTVGSYVKFFNSHLRELSKLINEEKRNLKIEIRNFYLEKLRDFQSDYGDVLKKVAVFVANLDVTQSSAKCAIEFGYCKPELKQGSATSFFDADAIRHPILERLPFSGEYVTNDVGMTGEKCGLLLYGVNGSGKSSLSKAVGLNIIMAQAGMYVACKSFVLCPYDRLFTRITSDDNIFKGKSSFAVEMSELRSILRFANNRSIVLGDEVCKGTEEKSALAIVNASLNHFVNKGINFILATHFHKLYDILDDYRDVKDKIMFRHLSIAKDGDKIIYGRKLREGIGDDIYGLEIAKYIIDNDDFIAVANETRNKIMNISGNLLDEKRSNYNKDLYMDRCAICGLGGGNLDTHHIKEQNMFNEDGLLGHVKKDSMDNIVPLCKKHHGEVTYGKLRVNGYKHGSSGRELDYEYVEENVSKGKKKLSDDVVEMIVDKFGGRTYSKRYMLNILEKDGVKISQNTLNKVLAGTY